MIIDPDVRSTFDFKFQPAVKVSRSAAAYQLHSKGRMGNIPFSKGDWLVKQGGELFIVPKRTFAAEYSARGFRQVDRRRVPAMVSSDDIETVLVSHGMQRETMIKRANCPIGTYFIDPVDEVGSKEPFAYIVFNDPEDDESLDGVHVEDLLVVCADYLARQRDQVQSVHKKRRYQQVIDHIIQASRYAISSSIGSVKSVRERLSERREREGHGKRETAAKGCSGCR